MALDDQSARLQHARRRAKAIVLRHDIAYATEYTFDHLGLDENLRQNISMEYYEAGHMMYIHLPSLRQMKRDLANFIGNAM